ncbi:hypothetical protein [Brevibacillus sp. FIR094]|uniref:hypothetical protein n=1 Tax=Brevibacillus sp. FIR094 TaxID=3134809 RepID=UPI003D197917
MNFKKIIVGIILTSVVVVGILLAVNYGKVEQPESQENFSSKPPTSSNGHQKVNEPSGADTDKIQPSAKVEQPVQPVAQESGKTDLYTNPQANFSFKPPTSWNGHYKVNQYAGADADKILPSAKHVVQFDYATKDGKGSEMLLMISVFTKTDWTRLSGEEGPPVGTSIAESNDMVYVYTTPQSNPLDSQSEDGKLFDQLFVDLKINESFALLK